MSRARYFLNLVLIVINTILIVFSLIEYKFGLLYDKNIGNTDILKNCGVAFATIAFLIGWIIYEKENNKNGRH